MIGRRLRMLPRSEDELWQMVKRERTSISQNLIRTLFLSVPRCVAACVAPNVGLQLNEHTVQLLFLSVYHAVINITSCSL